LFITVVVILIVAFIFLRLKYTPPITDVKLTSSNTNQIEVSWQDEDETPNITYTIFWSNKQGIKPHNFGTYIDSKSVVRFNTPKSRISKQKEKNPFDEAYGNKDMKDIDNENDKKTIPNTVIDVKNVDWLFVMITKDGFKTREYEIQVKKDQSFICNNLDARIFTRNNDYYNMTIEVDVLDDAEIYRIYTVLNDHEIEGNETKTLTQDFMVNGFRRIPLKIQIYDDMMVYISAIKSGIETERIFLLYNEKIEDGEDSERSNLQLCRFGEGKEKVGSK